MESVLSGNTSPAPIFLYWQQQHDIAAVDSFEDLENSDTDIVLLVQPPAMDPADIAAIDTWVRGGGKTIIFTDPMLVWPTNLPLGDKRRPLASGLLSPLLGHWGLELLAPTDAGAGSVELEFSGVKTTMVGIGSLVAVLPKKTIHADCLMSAENVIARCKVGKGHAFIVADADFLNDNLWADPVAMEQGDARRLTDILIADLQK